MAESTKASESKAAAPKVSKEPKAPKAPETTRPVDFLVPNQDLFEKVIDQRLAAHEAAKS